MLVGRWKIITVGGMVREVGVMPRIEIDGTDRIAVVE
jgi:hypothetical protein